MHLTYRKTCRVCNSGELIKVIDLGEQYLQGSFIKPGRDTPPLRRISTELIRCNPMKDEKACGLLQTRITVPPEVLYSDYWYRSGTNNTMRNHLKDIVDNALKFVKKENPNVLDIGCNDGTLLNNYPEEFNKYGVDPSDAILELKNINSIQSIFPSKELEDKILDSKMDIITSIAMFYDLEDPRSFVNAITRILDKNGIWIFEMSYMPEMLKMNSYDTICHEHLEYYSFSVIEKLLGMENMKVVKVSFNDINGGSMRCYATHQDNFLYENKINKNQISNVRKKEFDLALDTDAPYKNFQERIDKHKFELKKILLNLKREKKTIHLYGASTKGNTILQWCGIDESIIDFASDRNPKKDGAKTIGTNIPIINEEKSRAMKPDYYLVLPWHFKDEFLEREKEMINQGTGFIFPLPEIEIIKK